VKGMILASEVKGKPRSIRGRLPSPNETES